MASTWYPRAKPGHKGYQNDNGLVQQVEFTVPSAEILALNTTPQVLIEAPGIGKTIQFVDALLMLNHGGTDYAGSGTILFQLSDGAASPTTVTVSDTIAAATLINASADAYVQCQVLSAEVALTSNNRLEIAAGADPTTGDGTLRGVVTYRIVDFSDEN